MANIWTLLARVATHPFVVVGLRFAEFADDLIANVLAFAI